MVSLKFQGLKDLNGKSPDQTQADSLEIVVFYEFIKVDREQLEWNQKMLPEHFKIEHSYDVVSVLLVCVI